MSGFNFEDPARVQLFLDELQPLQPFTVVFATSKDEQRRYTGTLDPDKPTSRSSSVAMLDLDRDWETTH